MTGGQACLYAIAFAIFSGTMIFVIGAILEWAQAIKAARKEAVREAKAESEKAARLIATQVRSMTEEAKEIRTSIFGSRY